MYQTKDNTFYFEKFKSISKFNTNDKIEWNSQYNIDEKIVVKKEDIFKAIKIAKDLGEESFSNHIDDKNKICRCKKCFIIRISQNLSKNSFE